MRTKQHFRQRIWETLRTMELIAMAKSYCILETGYNNGVLRMNINALVGAVN